MTLSLKENQASSCTRILSRIIIFNQISSSFSYEPLQLLPHLLVTSSFFLASLQLPHLPQLSSSFISLALLRHRLHHLLLAFSYVFSFPHLQLLHDDLHFHRPFFSSCDEFHLLHALFSYDVLLQLHDDCFSSYYALLQQYDAHSSSFDVHLPNDVHSSFYDEENHDVYSLLNALILLSFLFYL